ncbi:MAG: helix-turn-helix domain-containing protein [Acidobacteriota bacterium]|nr:helix-turn-helix domain-containing protein [Acidobacteriota bacterium]
MKVKNNLEKKFNIAEAAQMLSLHPITVRRKIADKTLGYYKNGGKIFIGKVIWRISGGAQNISRVS